MRLPRRAPVRRLPGWPASAGAHPGGWWRGRRCWTLRLQGLPGDPPLTHLVLRIPQLFSAGSSPRALALQQRADRQWRFVARWPRDDPWWTVTLPQPVDAAALRLVWSDTPAKGVLAWHRQRGAAAHQGLSQQAVLCGSDPATLGSWLRDAELPALRTVARRRSEAPRALQVHWYGRFGNAAVQIVNALQLAGALGLEQVAVPPLAALRLPPGGDGGSPRLLPLADGPLAPRLRNRFFYRAPYAALAARPPDERYRVAQQRLRPLLDPAWWQGAVPDDELVVHLRGGDVFQAGWVHPAYVQPPLAYYRRAVLQAAADAPLASVRLVSEDRSNPCLEPLADWIARQGLAIRVQTSDFASDFGALLGARGLVASNSTLIGAATLLSDRLRRLYVFRRSSAVLPGDDSATVRDWGIVARCFVERAQGYPQRGEWRNSPAQRASMLTLPDDALDRV